MIIAQDRNYLLYAAKGCRQDVLLWRQCCSGYVGATWDGRCQMTARGELLSFAANIRAQDVTLSITLTIVRDRCTQ